VSSDVRRGTSETVYAFPLHARARRCRPSGLGLFAGGRANKDIANELGLGTSSVETLVSRVRAKVGAPTGAALAALLTANGLDDK